MSEVESVDSTKDYREPEFARVPDADVSPKACWNYLKSRVPTLLAIPAKSSDEKAALKRLHPFEAIKAMNRHQWNLFFHGFFAWTVDSMDFFCVSISATDIAASLNVEVTSITWGITLVLMLRSVGAVIFGYCGDRWGRKWPLCVCYILFVALEIATGFVKNLHQFLAVRSLFGIAMGGCYGLAAATALEDAPQVSRGFLSGIFLPGYSLGYVLATVFYRGFQTTAYTWKALFWFSAGPPFLLLVWRLTFDELDYFKELKEAKRLHNLRVRQAQEARDIGEIPIEGDEDLREITFTSELKEAFRTEWPLMIYLIFLMSGTNFMSHGSQDLFPTMLKKQAKLSPNALTVTNVVVNLGGCFGGIFWGQVSEFFGRRLAVIFCTIWGGAFLYPTFFRYTEAYIIPCGFLLQFAVMGAWGIIPVHLTELTSRTALRTMISGTAYQLGNLASSASSTIEAKIGSQFPLPGLGPGAYDYGKVMCIFMGCVLGYLHLVMFFGPERFHTSIRTDFMKEEHDVDSTFELDRIISPIPHPELDEKVWTSHTERKQ
ncbi:DEKNAAC103802 [Brettanomyces naardenensis]|uniref:DEKNAAC103802 n=1 Tax=Brettanomyces naardenensis TaxID=13370 RepID=A0A448YP71_BRENA|nr:DEKNAAC103802 [Brettanomyces naardenensis]